MYFVRARRPQQQNIGFCIFCSAMLRRSSIGVSSTCASSTASGNQNGYDHCGWVFKQGSLVKNWKKRFMVMRGRQLTYYDTAQINPRVKEKGSFKVITVELSGEIQNGLIVHGVGGRVLKLYTDSAENTSDWYNAILEACGMAPDTRASVCLPPERFSAHDSVDIDAEIELMDRLEIQTDESQVAMSGWLRKEGSRVKSWKKRSRAAL